jgi:uncharacterized protein YndB with AHSA1/START domain
MSPAVHAPPQTTLERRYAASPEEVWALWTTPAGIEAWWGPEGFAVKVHALDLRPGGELRYAMSAVAPETQAFMKAQGMPLTTEARLTFTEVVPPRLLAWRHLADFIPGVAPYDVGHRLELHPDGDGVRLTLTLDRMHDETWTQRAVQGWAAELGKLERALAPRAGRPAG